MKSVLKRSVALLWVASLTLACQQEPATEQASETDPAIDAAAVTEAIAAKDQAFAAGHARPRRKSATTRTAR